MVVELIFTANGDSVHSVLMENADYIPVPVVGDRVQVEGTLYTVESREYRYEKREPSSMINDASVRILLDCKPVGDTIHR